MKKKEKEDIIAKKRVAKASEETRGVPKIMFVMRMKPPKKSPPRMERNHRLTVLAKSTPGTWARKMINKAKMFVKSRDAEKKPKVRMNFARGSSL